MLVWLKEIPSFDLESAVSSSFSQYIITISTMSTLLFAPVSPPAAKVHSANPLKNAHTNSRHQIHVASSVASSTNNVTTTITAATRTVPNNMFVPIVSVTIFLGCTVLFADIFTFAVPPGTFRCRRFLGRRGDSNGNGTSGRILAGPDRPSTAASTTF